MWFICYIWFMSRIMFCSTSLAKSTCSSSTLYLNLTLKLLVKSTSFVVPVFQLPYQRQSTTPLFVPFFPLYMSPGQQLGQSSTLHLRVQHPQRPSTFIPDPDPLSPSHHLLPARVSHASLCRRRRGRTRQPGAREAGQAHLGNPRGGCRRKGVRGRQTPIPTSTLPLRAVPGLPRGRPQPRPLRAHGDVDLRGGRGLQPGTLKHHQLGPPALADWLAGPQRTFSEAPGADDLRCRLRSPQRHRGGRQVLGTGGTAWGRRGNPREMLEDSVCLCRVKVNVTLFASVPWALWMLIKCEPKTNETERTVLPETVVVNSHRTLTINKVYFLTCTWW